MELRSYIRSNVLMISFYVLPIGIQTKWEKKIQSWGPCLGSTDMINMLIFYFRPAQNHNYFSFTYVLVWFNRNQRLVEARIHMICHFNFYSFYLLANFYRRNERLDYSIFFEENGERTVLTFNTHYLIQFLH